MIAPEEAWRRLENGLSPLPATSIELEKAVGRVLANDLLSTCDVPAADVSAMDGVAVAGEMVPGDTVEVVATIAAGDPPGAVLPAGRAMRIMTGAPLPDGADRVVPVEEVEGSGHRLAIRVPAVPGAHIRRQGEVIAAGRPLLARDTLVTPGVVSLAATHGHVNLPVYGAPRITVLVTGDEVVAAATEPRPGQLRDSHTHFLQAAGRTLDLTVTPLGIAPDRPDALRQLVARGLESDVLLITGGVSMGEYDHVEQVLTDLGCEILFDAVAVQPGKPLVAARHKGGWVFGLPGNPASVMVGFWLFVRPALRCLMGYPDRFWAGALAGVLAAPLAGAKGRDRFLPAQVEFREGALLVYPEGARGSHDVGAYAAGTALVRVPAHASAAAPGAPCEVMPLADWRGRAEC